MILLKNCFHVESPHAPGGGHGWDVLTSGGRIERIAAEIDAHEAQAQHRATERAQHHAHEPFEVIDASRLVVVPGFVNTHHHFFQSLTRALPEAQNAKLFDWLIYHYEIWKWIDAEAVRVSTLMAVGELLKTGCTTTTDHHYLYPAGFEGDLVATQFEAAEQLGIRFSPSRGSMSLSKKDGGLPPDSVVQSEEGILKASEAAIQRFHDSRELSMRRITLAPCSPFSVTPQLLRDTAQLARAHGVRLHTHLAETVDENTYCREAYGKRPLELMEECEFVGPDVYFAHGIHFTDAELDRLAATQTGVSHCPSSNMRLASGIARVCEMQRRGIPVSIGVDGSASNDTGDYLGEMRNALLLQRVRYGADAIEAREVFDMATTGGARALGFEHVGRIEPGWAADLALFDVHRFEYAGALADPAAALLFAGFNHQAAYTIVNGNVVVRNGRLVGYDEERLFQEGRAAARRLVERAKG